MEKKSVSKTRSPSESSKSNSPIHKKNRKKSSSKYNSFSSEISSSSSIEYKKKKHLIQANSSSEEESKHNNKKKHKEKHKQRHSKKYLEISRLREAVYSYTKENYDEENLFTKLSLSIEQFREGIIGRNVLYESPFGGKIITLYADDTASGRPHDVVENYIRSILPIYANTHSDNSYFPVSMHLIYKDAIRYLLEIFNAPKNYELIGVGNGCTAAIFRFQEILMQKYGQKFTDKENPPVCFVTEYEHHSNILSWQKFGFKVIPIRHTYRNAWEKGLRFLNEELEKNLQSPLIVVSLSAASNVTGQKTPLKLVSDFMIKQKLKYSNIPIIWSLDLAAFVPHDRLDIKELKVDAIFISPHKLTGGPGSCGILIFNSEYYNLKAPPTNPAGGTVSLVIGYTPEDVVYSDNILERESPGTPGILQLIRAKEAFALQDKVGMEFIQSREDKLKEWIFDAIDEMNEKWGKIKKKSGCRIEILGTKKIQERSSVFSVVFFDPNGHIYHYHLIQRFLNDIFGIQIRSGCNCAGPFGMKLLEKSFKLKENMDKWIQEMNNGNAKNKPGWVRFNVHYSFTDEDVEYLLFALKFVTEHGTNIAKEYYEETNGDYHINQRQRNVLNPDLNQMNEATVRRIKIKEIKECKRNEYLRRIMGCVQNFCNKNH